MFKKICLAMCVLLTTLFQAQMAQAQTGRGLHKKIFAVPVPGQVVIDGKLDDWDLSGQIHSFVVAETAETMSARLAVMYDAEAIYISNVVRDTSPMMNRHDPKVDPEKAWDADICQIWFATDPDLAYPIVASSFEGDTAPPVASAYLWYFTDRKEPNLAIFRGMQFTKPLRPDLGANGVIPASEFQATYLKSEDGGGYTLEYRIPYKTLGLKRAPKANDLLAACFAVFWSRPDGLKTAGGAAWAYDVMGRPGFPFQDAGTWGKISFSDKGNLPKSMVEEGLPPEKPLPLKFSYELPKDRQITIQLFNEKNEVARTLVAQQDRRGGNNIESWDGLDDRGQLLPPGKYSWKGVQHDPITTEVRFSAHNSGNPPWPTDDNKGGWGGDHGVPSAVSPLADGMVLAWNGCEYGWGIIRVDLSGKKLWGTKHTAEHLATDGKRLFVAGNHHFVPNHGVSVLDLIDSRPMNFGGAVPYLAPPEGGTEETNHVTGLAYHAGKVYVSYAKRDLIAVFDAERGGLMEKWSAPTPAGLAARPDGTLLVVSDNKVLTMKDGQTSALIESGLDAPKSIAVGADGVIYVANAGAAQSVAVFDPTGKPLRTLGKPGGRPAVGKYDPSGIYAPGGIGVDAQNRLWVAETTDSPKRISVWDTATGNNLAEYFGGSSYFGYGYIDPAKPDEMLAHNVLWTIDWKNLKVAPSTTIWRKLTADMIEPVSPDGYQGIAKIITAADGTQYMWGNGQAKSILSRRDGDVFKPIASVVAVYDSPLYPGQGIPLLDDRAKYPGGQYLWQDQNDDQCVQAEEVNPIVAGHNGGIAWVDADLGIWLSNGSHLASVGKRANGSPIYDVTKLQATPYSGKVSGYFWRDPDGFTYSYGGKMVKWSSAGEPLWQYNGIIEWRDALNLPMTGPGKLHGMTGPMGTAGNFFAMMTYFGVNHVFTRDGIYVAALLKDGRIGGTDENTGQPEGQGGQFVKFKTDPAGPDRYFIIHGGQDSRVWEVLGLDTVEPIVGGVYEHTPAGAELAKAKFDEYTALVSGSRKLTITRGRTALDLAEPVGKSVDATRGFEARAAYDAENLYVRYDVTATAPLVNTEPDPKMIFKGGNSLDIQIATDPAAEANRKTPGPGDIRVVVTQRDGKPFAVIYRPRVAGFTGERTVFRSPTGEEPFDVIEMLDVVDLKYTKTESGFTAIVTLPLETLGLKLSPGQPLRMDLGYVFGNDTGTRTSTRAYWSNNGFSANVTNDLPNESRLEPAEWGNATVE